MDDIDVRAHQNLVDFTRWVTRLDPNGVVLDADGVLVAVGEIDWPSNRVGIVTGEHRGPEAWAATADGFLAEHGTFGCIFVRQGIDDELGAALTDRGYTQYGTSPEMVRTERLADAPTPPGIDIVLATTAEQVAGYATVTGQAFAHLGFLEEPTIRMLDRPGDLLADDVLLTVAEQEGQVVGGAMAVFAGEDDVAYVAWVSCADHARGHGVGDAVTRAVTNAAFDRGANLVTLEASRFGAGTYRRMGYEDRYEYDLLIRTGGS